MPGIRNAGVFVYRTIKDLEQIIAYAAEVRSAAAVIGGGLLGLEAAKAALRSRAGNARHRVHSAADAAADRRPPARGCSCRKSKALGVRVHLNKGTKEVLGRRAVVTGIGFNDGSQLDVDMIVVSAGIRPARRTGPATALDPSSAARTACWSTIMLANERSRHLRHRRSCAARRHGLRPGRPRATKWRRSSPRTCCGSEKPRSGAADLSTKLKLMGVDVASFGALRSAPPRRARPLDVRRSVRRRLQKLAVLATDGKQAASAAFWSATRRTTANRARCLAKSDKPLAVPPRELMVGKVRAAAAGRIDSAGRRLPGLLLQQRHQGGGLCSAIHGAGPARRSARSSNAPRPGTGCGGCIPLVTDLLNAELAKRLGKTVQQQPLRAFRLLAHRAVRRSSRSKQLKTFEALRLAVTAQGHGCEICKPAVASILASLWNDHILDRCARCRTPTTASCANMQRGGLLLRRAARPRRRDHARQADRPRRGRQGIQPLHARSPAGSGSICSGSQVQDLPDIWGTSSSSGGHSKAGTPTASRSGP